MDNSENIFIFSEVHNKQNLGPDKQIQNLCYFSMLCYLVHQHLQFANLRSYQSLLFISSSKKYYMFTVYLFMYR